MSLMQGKSLLKGQGFMHAVTFYRQARVDVTCTTRWQPNLEVKFSCCDLHTHTHIFFACYSFKFYMVF